MNTSRSLTHPEIMLASARELIAKGSDPQRLLEVAAAHRDKWAKLAAEQEAGAHFDGRASIWTGETYAEARDRWETYRQLLRALVQSLVGDSE